MTLKNIGYSEKNRILSKKSACNRLSIDRALKVNLYAKTDFYCFVYTTVTPPFM